MHPGPLVLNTERELHACCICATSHNFASIIVIILQALIVHKPAGINKHFSVGLVSERLTEQLGKPVLAGSIWKKLRTMFDLAAVDDREEAIPFPIDV